MTREEKLNAIYKEIADKDQYTQTILKNQVK